MNQMCMWMSPSVSILKVGQCRGYHIANYETEQKSRSHCLLPKKANSVQEGTYTHIHVSKQFGSPGDPASSFYPGPPKLTC